MRTLARICLPLGPVVAAILTFVWCSAAIAEVGPRSWARKSFQYVAVDQGLRDVLHELSAAAAVPIDVSDAVRGQVRGRWPEMPAGEFLDQLARTYALEWYFDGSLLSVSALSEDETRMLPLHGVELERLRHGLEAAGLMDQRFGLRAGPAAGVALVSGPPRFTALVQQSLDAIAASDAARPPSKLPAEAAPMEQKLAVFRGSAATILPMR